MKKLLRALFAPIKLSDYIKLSVLTTLNMIYCCIWAIVMLGIGLIAYELLVQIYPLNDQRNEAALVIADCLPPIVLTILAGALISKLRVWLLSLPVQFLLYTIGMYFVYASGIVMGGQLTVWYCAQFAAILLLIQIPGVAVGLTIRYLLRKAKTRKQPASAE